MSGIKAVAYLWFSLAAVETGLLSAQAVTPHYFLTTAAGYIPSISVPVALNQPPVAAAVAYDSHGVLYYSDGGHIWRLNADGTDTLIAGSYSNAAMFVEGEPAVDAPFTKALTGISDFKFDSLGNLYIASEGANKVYRVTPDGAIATFAGTGAVLLTTLSVTGPGVPATSVAYDPTALALDANNTLYVGSLTGFENNNGQCWEVLSFPEDGSSSTLVGDHLTATAAQPCALEPGGITVVGSQLFVTSAPATFEIPLPMGPLEVVPVTQPSFENAVISAGPNGWVYGFGSAGLVEWNPTTFETEVVPNSSAAAAGTYLAVNPVTGDVAVVAGGTVNVLSASSGIYQAVACNAPVFSGDTGPVVLAAMGPGPVAADAAGDVFISDATNSRIRKFTPNGIVTTIAGTGTRGDTGDMGPALQAQIDPGELALDAAGNVYFINLVPRTIRKIDRNGNITTIAGGGANKPTAGATGTSVSILTYHLAADSAGDIYFDLNQNQLFELNTSGTLQQIAGTGMPFYITNGMPAIQAGLGTISSIAVDRSGTVYFGETAHLIVCAIDSQGNLQILAGQNLLGMGPSLPTPGPATGSNIGYPQNLAVDSQGNLYFFPNDFENIFQLARVDTSGNLALIGGSAKPVGTSSGDGGDAALGAFTSILGLAVDGAGNLYVSDAGHVIRKMSPFNPASPPPYVSSGGVIGAGGSLPAVQAVSPGGEVSIFGANFVSVANAHTLGAGDLVGGKVPTNLAGVCASFGGSPAAMLGVYPSQLNVQVGALTAGAVTVQVTTNCGTPQAVTSNFGGVVVQTASPEFYSFAPDPIGGHNPVAAVNAVTGAYIGPPGLISGVTFTPAKAGDIVQAYATGFGATTPPFGLGVIPGAAGNLNAAYSLTLGGVPIPAANIEYAGISPCCAGFYQIDFTVPSGIPTGALPLVITIAGEASPPQAYIQVSQ